MTKWQVHYERWMNHQELDADLRQKLEALEGNDAQLEECFYKNLEFGTGGMRGILGPGTNRLNIYTIHKAAEGLARYIEKNGEEAKTRGVVIAYDCRHQSPEFAIEVAKTLGHHGIQSYVFESLRPTPELSFAVRYLHAFAGVMITASHNPPEYNGLKVYGEDGGQVISETADAIVAEVNGVDNELTVQTADEATLKSRGLLKVIGEEVDRAYLSQLKKVVINQNVIDRMADELQIVYTPFHGTGTVPVREGLKAIGFKNVHIVEEQAIPDPEFSTVESPNPEQHDAFELAMETGEKLDADVLLGTDPDTDRMGVAVRHPDGEYGVLTGNQVGALLAHYIFSQKQAENLLPENGILIKTIVTSELGRAIAEAHGVKTLDTLTGFKYIAEKINEYEQTGAYTFLIGYEESYGYLIKDFARDKDAVQSCLLIAEVAAYYKAKGMTLYEGLIEIFETYGFYLEGLESLKLEGIAGAEKIEQILNTFRNEPPKAFAERDIVMIEDYQTSQRVHVETGRSETIELPTSNVLKYILDDESWVCLRPSGTEPLIKVYFGVKGESMAESQSLLETLKTAVMNRVHSI